MTHLNCSSCARPAAENLEACWVSRRKVLDLKNFARKPENIYTAVIEQKSLLERMFSICLFKGL